MTMKPLTSLDPGATLLTPNLWLGLVVAALLIAARGAAAPLSRAHLIRMHAGLKRLLEERA